MSKHRSLSFDEPWEDDTFICLHCHKEITEFEYTVHNGVCADCDKKNTTLRRRQRKNKNIDYDFDFE